MDLGIAGALSGAGNAGTQALSNLQTTMGTSFLQQERDKLETERLQLQEQYASAREGRGYAQAEALQSGNQDFQKGLLQTRIGADIISEDLKGRANKAEKDLDRTSIEGIHNKDRASKEALTREEIALKKPYYDALAGMYGKKGDAAGKVGSKSALSGEDKKQAEYLKSVTEPLINNLSKQLEFALPEEKDAIRQRLDHVVEEARRVANLDAPKPPAPGQIKDKFAGTIKPKVSPGGP